ncbi:hypothetical protein NPIL_405031 [Nephila pilipes]|uniref:Uncharacterized protein n=1 Tax=Nephila pilipes TaxID=299642 RepID=A0A8X6TTX1_NEPPI|nr:hypothetical protein NPIL_405031 [Nephila pilipes]
MVYLPDSRLGALSLVFLGIRTSYKDDMGASSAELVYGTALKTAWRIIFQFASNVSAPEFLQSLRRHVCAFKPVPASRHSS